MTTRTFVAAAVTALAATFSSPALAAGNSPEDLLAQYQPVTVLDRFERFAPTTVDAFQRTLAGTADAFVTAVNPALTGAGSLQSRGVCMNMRCSPGHFATSGTWLLR